MITKEIANGTADALANSKISQLVLSIYRRHNRADSGIVSGEAMEVIASAVAKMPCLQELDLSIYITLSYIVWKALANWANRASEHFPRPSPRIRIIRSPDYYFVAP